MSYTLAEYDPDEDFDRWFTDATADRVRDLLDHLRAKSVLEVGCATGRMTERLAEHDYRGRRILAVTLDEGMAERARDRDLTGVNVVCGDVLDFKNMEFEAIVCCSVLHEVPSVSAILRKCRELLAPRGRVIVTVPNASSIHLVRSGILASRPSARSAQFGVRRLLGIEEWHSALITGSGLKVVERGTFVLKPYPNAEMETLPEEVLDHLARYRGPGGALCWFDLEAA